MQEYNPEILAVLLNLGIAVGLSLVGVCIFITFWLKEDRYRLPAFETGRYQKMYDTVSNRIGDYIGRMRKVLSLGNSELFINRFGFEYFFYLQFHRQMATNFLLCFLIVCLWVLIFSFSHPADNNFFLKRIVGIYYQGSKSHPVLNTAIMASVSLLTTYNLRKMMHWFQSLLTLKARTMKLNMQDEYHFILNTGLLYGGNPYDDNQKSLLPYLRRMIRDNNFKTVILEHSSPPDYVDLANILTDIDETIIYWEHLWFLRKLGWLM